MFSVQDSERNAGFHQSGGAVPAGICPDAEKFSGSHGVPVNPGDGSNPMRGSHDTVR